MRSEKIWSIWLLRALRCGKMHFRAFKNMLFDLFRCGKQKFLDIFFSPLESQICIVKVQLSFTQRRQSFKETEHTPSHIHMRGEKKRNIVSCLSAGRSKEFSKSICQNAVCFEFRPYTCTHPRGLCRIFSVSSAAISKNRKRPTVFPAWSRFFIPIKNGSKIIIRFTGRSLWVRA